MEKRIVIITGATSGIGKATAVKFLEEGFYVIGTGRREERLKELERTYSASFGYYVLDVRDAAAVDAFVRFVEKNKFFPDVLVNNAGLAAGLAPADQADWADWEQMIDTNVKGLLYVTRRLLPFMVERRKGHIINVGSVAGKEVYPNGGVYCATKFAVEAITRGLRMDLLPHRIKVSSVSPGMVETEFSLVRFKGNKEKAARVYEGLKPLRPEDVAEAILWIATRPEHVHIQDIWIMPTAQASPFVIKREI